MLTNYPKEPCSDAGKTIIFYIVLFSTILPVSQIIGSSIGGLFVICAYSAFLLVVFLNHGTILIQTPKFLIIFTLLILVVFSAQLIRGNFESLTNIGALVLMIGVFFINTTIVPKYIKKESFMWSTIFLSLILILFGILMNVAYYIGFLSSNFVWHSSTQLPLIGLETPYLMSITSNPNVLGFILAMGTIFSVGIYKIKNDKRMILIIMIIGFSLFLTQSRSSWLATFTAIFVLIGLMDMKLKNKSILIIVVGLAVGIFLVPIVLTNVFSYEIELSGRVPLWTGGLLAISDNLLVGFGFGSTSGFIEEYTTGRYSGDGIHNSYLRVFLIGGIVAGLAYIVFIFRSVTLSGGEKKNKFDVVIFSAALATLPHQMFEAHSMLGYTITSVLTSIVFGYVISSYIYSIKFD